MSKTQGLTVEDAERLIEPVIHFPDIDAAFQRIRPITDFRKDDTEARILYVCRRLKPDTQPNGSLSQNGYEGDDLYILKCKVQAPSVLAGGLTTPIPGPSEHTLAEIQALKHYSSLGAEGLPHYITHKVITQGDDGPMPKGYICLVIMTLMPGRTLMELGFWSLPDSSKEEIRKHFLVRIKSVWKMGFEPYDCALRNVLWEAEAKRLSLVDFEHWHATTTDPINMTERLEMERWGLLQRPPPTEHWKEWFYAENLTKKQGK